MAHFLLVENAYKNPYSLKAINGARKGVHFWGENIFPQKLTTKSSIDGEFPLELTFS
jgi:hypothetical protein